MLQQLGLPLASVEYGQLTDVDKFHKKIPLACDSGGNGA
jgi:hypothetical protein